MSDTKKVLRKLLADHQGESNSITQEQLANATGVNTSTLRSEIRRLREERNIPIANKRNGYYVIQSEEELQDFIGHKNEEIQSKRQTIEDTLQAWDGFHPEEIEVEPEGETVEPTYECDNCEDEITQEERRYPENHEKPVCPGCYGKFLMNGKSFEA